MQAVLSHIFLQNFRHHIYLLFDLEDESDFSPKRLLNLNGLYFIASQNIAVLVPIPQETPSFYCEFQSINSA
jgi:hypothetical protein